MLFSQRLQLNTIKDVFSGIFLKPQDKIVGCLRDTISPLCKIETVTSYITRYHQIGSINKMQVIQVWMSNKQGFLKIMTCFSFGVKRLTLNHNIKLDSSSPSIKPSLVTLLESLQASSLTHCTKIGVCNFQAINIAIIR